MIERRKNARTAIDVRVYFVCLDDDGFETVQDVATVVNISDSGLLIESALPILTKKIRISAAAKDRKTLEIVAELVYSMQLAQDRHHSGLSFAGDPDRIRRFVTTLREAGASF